jgi:hypothetical protein
MEQVPSVQEAERAVLAVADEWYDLAHGQYVNVDDWRKIAVKMDKAVQTLRKARARAMGV